MENIHIESVCRNDAGFLNALMNRASLLQILNEVPTELHDWVDAIEEWSHDNDEEDYIVFDGDTPIGWLGINGLLNKDRSVYLKMAAFLPEYQGRGFGTFAIRELMSDLKSKGMERVILYTDRDNDQAQVCYRKCGFQVVESLVETMSNGKDVQRYRMEACLQKEKSIQQIDQTNREEINTFIRQQWFSLEMVVHGEKIDLGTADGWFVREDGEIIGLITYRIIDKEMEILSLDSLRERQGIGTALLEQAVKAAKISGCHRIMLITTNDNLNALQFYQKRGFDMVALYWNTVEAARKLKPEIPMLGDNGIPIKHEIELEMRFFSETQY